MRGARSSTHDDYDRIKDALHELKAKYRKVCKENSRLRKQLNQAEVFIPEEDIKDLIIISTSDKEKPDDKKVCGQCNSTETTEFEAGVFSFFLCNSCGHKKKLKPKP